MRHTHKINNNNSTNSIPSINDTKTRQQNINLNHNRTQIIQKETNNLHNTSINTDTSTSNQYITS